MVLVPATMELLGDRNWWLPRWLDRLLPRLRVDGEAPGRMVAASGRLTCGEAVADARAGAGAGARADARAGARADADADAQEGAPGERELAGWHASQA